MRRIVVVLSTLFLLAFAAAQTKTAPTKKKIPAKPSAHSTAAPVRPRAIIDTTAGRISCVLFPDKAPVTVDNFIGLATGKKDWINPASQATKHGVPLYSGTVFHRVIPGFMIQGGDPMGNGAGGPGYKFKNEYSDLRFDQPGRLAMANAGVDTNGSQFFITVSARPLYQLDGKYTIFGQCSNLDIANAIANAPKTFNFGSGEQSQPINPVKITKIAITTGPAAPTGKRPAARRTTTKPSAARSK